MDSETTFWSNKLKEIRSKKHLTQQQLAVSLGISSKTVYRLEHSSEVPSKKLQNLLTQTFPEYFEMIQISDTELFHIFEDLLSHLFKGEKILTSNETPQDIFQKIIHAYFSSRDWNSNSWKYDEAVPKQTIFFYIPEVNFDSLLSALFTKDHSGSSDEIKTLIWLQEAVFLLANKLFFELFAPHILSDYDKKQEEILERTRKETHIDELRALPNTPDISLLLYHLRTIKKISFSRICKILDQLCSHLEQGTFHKEQPLIDYVVSNLKVTPQKLRNCEHGTSSPSLPLLEALAWIFNLKNLSSILYYPTNNLFSQKKDSDFFFESPHLDYSTFSSSQNAYLYYALLERYFSLDASCYSDLLPAMGFQMDDHIEDQAARNFGFDSLPGELFYTMLQKEGKQMGALECQKDLVTTGGRKINQYYRIYGVSLPTLYRYYNAAPPDSPTIQKLLEIRNNAIFCVYKNQLYSDTLFLSPHLAFFSPSEDSPEAQENQPSFQNFIEFLLGRLYAKDSDQLLKQFHFVLDQWVDPKVLKVYLPKKPPNQENPSFYRNLFDFSSYTPERPSVDHLLKLCLFAQKMAECLVISPHLNRYLQAYQIPEDLKSSMLPKDLPDPIAQKRYLFAIDIMIGILSAYYNNLSAHDFLNRYVVDHLSQLDLISELKSTIPQEVLCSILFDDDLEGFDEFVEMEEMEEWNPIQAGNNSNKEDKLENEEERDSQKNSYQEQMKLYRQELEQLFQEHDGAEQSNQISAEEMKEIQKSAEKELFMALSLIHSLSSDESHLLSSQEYLIPLYSNDEPSE